METTRFVAPDIECDGCANAIKTALGRVGGVQDVTVDVPSQTVTIVHDPHTTAQNLADAMHKAGFPVSR